MFDKIVSAANFAMYSSNSKCPQISSYVLLSKLWAFSEISFTQ